MTEKEILAELEQILQGILFNNDISLTTETKRRDVPGWDSFNYVNFIVGVEMRYDIKFRVADVESFRNVGDIVREIERLTA